MTGVDQRGARRFVRAQTVRFCAERAETPGPIADPDDRTRVVEAWRWLGGYLDPGDLDRLPDNLIPLVRPDGTTFDGWDRSSEEGDTDGTASAG